MNPVERKALNVVRKNRPQSVWNSMFWEYVQGEFDLNTIQGMINNATDGLDN